MSEALTARRAAIRRAVLHLVLGVVALDTVAIGFYYLAHIDQAQPKVRMMFTAVWTVATMLVVATLLKRVRKLRYSR